MTASVLMQRCGTCGAEWFGAHVCSKLNPALWAAVGQANDPRDVKIARLTAEVEALRAAAAWTPVTDSLPAVSQTVLACYANSAGKVRRIRACWIAAKTVEADTDDENTEYDEATDTYWTPAGWYEQIDNWADYSAVFVCEGEVTHWMLLPPAPDAKEQA